MRKRASSDGPYVFGMDCYCKEEAKEEVLNFFDFYDRDKLGKDSTGAEGGIVSQNMILEDLLGRSSGGRSIPWSSRICGLDCRFNFITSWAVHFDLSCGTCCASGV